MKTSRISYGFLCSFLLALFFFQWAQLPAGAYMGALVLIGALSATVLAVLLKKETAAVLLAVVLGITAAHLCALRTVHNTQAGDIESFATGESVTVQGWIADMPDVRPVQTKFTIEVQSVDDIPARGRVLVTEYAPWPPLQYGDEVVATGKLERPTVIEGFDYPHYLELNGIRAVIERGKVKKSGDTVSAEATPLFRSLFGLRKTIEDEIGMLFPEPHGSLLAGLLTGSRRGLPKDLTDDFRAAGLTHIIAISGYNITIILTLLGSALFWLPIRRRVLPLSIGIALFTLFVGAGAPVIRAAIMGILGLLALYVGRVPTVRLSILWTAFFMLLWEPLLLWYDASFQLSFLAVIGITELSPFFKEKFKRVPEAFAIRESLVATIAALIGTLPLSILLFRQITLIAPLTNVLVAPLIPIAMLFGTLSVLLGFLWMPLGLLIAYPVWAILHLIISVAKLGAAIPFASFTF